jgi:hypothetical protein
VSLDAFSVVVAFLAVIEVALGVTAAVLGARQLRRPPATSGETDLRRPLIALVAATLVVVTVVSAPLFYLLLASWVPRWSGVMCVEGVRRIGLGAAGAVGMLPRLVGALDVAKPLVVFTAGAWMVLRRATGTSAARRAAVAAIALGCIAAFDGAAEAAYVVIPKQEVEADAGCCTTTTHAAARDAGLTPDGRAPSDGSRGTTAMFLATAAALGAASLAARRADGVFGAPAVGAVLCVAAAATIPLATSYLADVVAPAVLHLPYHRCVWCAFAAAPETIVGAAVYLAGVFCVGWAWIERLTTVHGAGGADPARRLYGTAAFCLLGAASMSAGLVLCS